jgi:hypothetical protein
MRSLCPRAGASPGSRVASAHVVDRPQSKCIDPPRRQAVSSGLIAERASPSKSRGRWFCSASVCRARRPGGTRNGARTAATASPGSAPTAASRSEARTRPASRRTSSRSTIQTRSPSTSSSRRSRETTSPVEPRFTRMIKAQAASARSNGCSRSTKSAACNAARSTPTSATRSPQKPAPTHPDPRLKRERFAVAAPRSAERDA